MNSPASIDVNVSPGQSTAAGLLLIGHGTRDQTGTDQFFELGRILADRLGSVPVAVSLLEFQEPTIPQAFQELIDRGVQRVHVAPLLLFAAGHAKDDIPAIIRQCIGESPEVTTEQSRPLSRHPSIVELMVERISESLAMTNSPPSRTALIAVGRGSRWPCASTDMRMLTEIVAQRFAFAASATAFYAMASPSLPEVIDQVAGSGQFDSIVIHPHLLFEGRLYQAIMDQVNEAGMKHADVKFIVSNYLGPHANVADAIIDRSGLGATQNPERA
ncbi:Sirohydrochlorin cobaltochelatase [Rubripirellula lacrimiformis]|uniref:Sirohydrochlorin cobaltochelatase n=1 Tax=Rubripirellula lacrimiformis TaxID=1930273 RepID=A0A517NKI1_9BACT|nr:sirohydrochlorin chelatase [Rubripirellula lacrimiformis]QDT07648.1 Sirohydrochlorin cobaltochelatase [Rubripirellula lacrimiformis]